MSVMGVRVNQGSGGVDTSLADTLMKAFLGDPEREMKLAMARRQYETEALRQQQLQAATAYDVAHTNELTRKQDAIEAAVDPYAGVIKDNLTRSGAYNQPAREEPVPVDLSFKPYDKEQVPPQPVPVTSVGPEAVSPTLLPQKGLFGESRPELMTTTLPQMPEGTAEPVPVQIDTVGPEAMPDNWLRRPQETINRPDDITLTPED